MPSWLLLLFLLLVWFVWVIACAAQHAVEQARHGIPEDKRSGVTFCPVFPIFPLPFWAVALLIDYFADPWGTVAIGALHAAYAAILVGSIILDAWQLRHLDSPTHPGDGILGDKPKAGAEPDQGSPT